MYSAANTSTAIFDSMLTRNNSYLIRGEDFRINGGVSSTSERECCVQSQLIGLTKQARLGQITNKVMFHEHFILGVDGVERLDVLYWVCLLMSFIASGSNVIPVIACSYEVLGI